MVTRCGGNFNEFNSKNLIQRILICLMPNVVINRITNWKTSNVPSILDDFNLEASESDWQ